MRITTPYYTYTDGEHRDKSGFLLLPKEIKGELRWLERATWRQIYSSNYADSGWEDVNWINP